MQNKVSEIKVIDRSKLRSFDFDWIKLTDHFVSTVGPAAGSGRPLGRLLVLADAELAPKSSFPMHGHNNMEILTWVVKGTLHHKDNMGQDQYVAPKGLQLMSARDGVAHAEGNSHDEPLRLLQIWIQPSKVMRGKAVIQTAHVKNNGFELLAAKTGAPLLIEPDVKLWAAVIENESVKFEVEKDQSVYAVSIGKLNWNGTEVSDGAGMFLTEGALEVKGSGQAIIIIQ